MMTRLLRRYWIVTLAALCVTAAALPAELQSGASVYVLPMRSGFNLYLASQLTQSNALTVVTDAPLADFILTDSIGAAFEQSMEELYPKPKPEEPVKAKEEDKKEEDKKGSGGLSSMVDAYSASIRRPSTFSRSDGTYFLVDRHSRIVIWSTFFNHRDTRNEAMNKDAAQMVKRLKKFLKSASATAAP